MKTLVTCAVMAAIVMVGAEDILKEEDIELVKDKKLFPELYACFMNTEPCPEKLVIYRDAIPKYIETKCDSCSAKEKALFEKLIKVVYEYYPEESKALMNKLTPKAQE